MKHLKLTLEKALEAYKNGDEKQKKLLIDLYGKEYFLVDIKDRVTDYESACEVLGIDPKEEEDFEELFGEDAPIEFARHQIVTGIKALRGGWVPDLKNTSQAKYYNYRYWNPSERKFSSGSSYLCNDSSFGLARMLPTLELATHADKIFNEQYNLILL